MAKSSFKSFKWNLMCLFLITVLFIGNYWLVIYNKLSNSTYDGLLTPYSCLDYKPPSFDVNQTPNNISFHIFQIGVNKAGTQGLYVFFVQNNIPSAHWRWNTSDRNTNMKNNMFRIYKRGMNESLLKPYGGQFKFISDFQAHEQGVLWKTLFEQHTDAKFILNIRNIRHWLKSKHLHVGDTNATTKQTLKQLRSWYHLFYNHNCKVIKFFAQHNASHRLLIFDIEDDPIPKLTDFFAGFGLILNGSHWGHVAPTCRRFNRYDPIRIHKQLLLEKWNEISKEHPDLLVGTDPAWENQTELWRIQTTCPLIERKTQQRKKRMQLKTLSIQLKTSNLERPTS